MNKSTIKKVSFHKKINKKTKLLKVEIDGEEMEIAFDPDEFPENFTHDDVIETYRNDGIEVIDWTEKNYF